MLSNEIINPIRLHGTVQERMSLEKECPGSVHLISNLRSLLELQETAIKIPQLESIITSKWRLLFFVLWRVAFGTLVS